jgi:hypothetical protein
MAEKLPTRGGMKKVQKLMAEKPKKASTSYSPAPMSAKQKETTRRAAEKKQAVKNIKKDTMKIAGAAGKVAGKVTSTAKKVVKAEVGAAKKAVGFATKAAMAPTVGVTKVAKAGLKALAKKERPVTRQMYSNKNLKNK